MRVCLPIILSFWAALAGAQNFPVPERSTVNDFADLLPDDLEQAWHGKLTALEAETSIEFTIVTLPSQTPYAPDQTMEAFATALFNSWGVGKADSDNGIMLLVLRDDRAMRIELGAGYGRAWDGTARDIVERDVLPAFRAGDYARGIDTGSEAILSSIARPFAAGQPAPTRQTDPFGWVMAALAGVAIFGVKYASRIVDRFRTCPACGARGGVRTSRRVITRSTRVRRGSAERTTTCGKCGHRSHKIIALPLRSDTPSSRGGGGFGGGRSGGGGASGRW